MQTVKAIETRYNGYRFRSRLEARIAVFWDNYGVNYEYEEEGFKIPVRNKNRWEKPICYLPDFCLFPTNDNPLIINFGDPEGINENTAAIINQRIYLEIKPRDLPEDDFVDCLIKMQALTCITGFPVLSLFGVPDIVKSRHNAGIAVQPYIGPSGKYQYKHSLYHIPYDDRYIKAATAARSARFEYGESGAL